jgi:putative peptide zinc metalloprotease protein
VCRGSGCLDIGHGELIVDPLPPLTKQSRLVLHELTVVPEDNGEYLVGNPRTGVYVALPGIGVTVIDQLRGGATLGAAGEAASVGAGEEVDAVDFGHTLVELGFVAGVDGRPISPPADAPARRWIGGVRPEQVRPLFAACVGLMVAVPAYRPAAEPDNCHRRTLHISPPWPGW